MQTTQLSAPPSLGRLYVRAAGRAATDAVVGAVPASSRTVRWS